MQNLFGFCVIVEKVLYLCGVLTLHTNNYMTTLQAYYNGSAFVPVMPVKIRTGQKFNLRIEQTSISASAKAAEFARITQALHEINRTEPLPEEFDRIMAQGTHFNAAIL
jgi:hypothetical protein